MNNYSVNVERGNVPGYIIIIRGSVCSQKVAMLYIQYTWRTATGRDYFLYMNTDLWENL